MRGILELVHAGIVGAMFAYMVLSAFIGEPVPLDWLLHPFGGG